MQGRGRGGGGWGGRSRQQHSGDGWGTSSAGGNFGVDDYDVERAEPAYGRYDGDHVFGIQPVRAALKGARRKFKELIVQEGAMPTNKKDEGAADEIAALALQMGLDVREFPKHDLNMLSGNRPHQGFVLRAEPLDVDVITSGLEPPVEGAVGVVLALDEVTDPMNLGALLRTALFLGVDQVVICAKNSAPLSPTVSKASAGAMELVRVAATNNMMRFLDKSKDAGWAVCGTSLGEGTVEVSAADFSRPTILVLGNEGHGIRTNVLNRCDTTVKLEGGSESDVDSLNVSVTGGILLHHILALRKA